MRSDCSYFLSWGWIGLWLEHFSDDLRPTVLQIWHKTDLVGMGLFVSRDIKRHIAIHSKAMFLNEYPFDGKNMVIEYNGLISERGFEEAVYSKTVEYLLHEYPMVDEFHFAAISAEPGCRIFKKYANNNLNILVDEESISWQVDLGKLSLGLDNYLATLSSNTRAQIRRSLKLYQLHSPVTLTEALNLDEALVYFTRLKELHTQRWQSKGETGSFANPIWEQFHTYLIQKRFDAGEIQLLRIANEHDIAYLLNYIWRKKVYVLQMGFNYTEDKRIKPGYVAHSMAIVHNRAKGMVVYDFMHGAARYKRSLSDGDLSLYWVILQRRRIKFIIEKIAVGAVRIVRKMAR